MIFHLWNHMSAAYISDHWQDDESEESLTAFQFADQSVQALYLIEIMWSAQL